MLHHPPQVKGRWDGRRSEQHLFAAGTSYQGLHIVWKFQIHMKHVHSHCVSSIEEYKQWNNQLSRAIFRDAIWWHNNSKHQQSNSVCICSFDKAFPSWDSVQHRLNFSAPIAVAIPFIANTPVDLWNQWTSSIMRDKWVSCLCRSKSAKCRYSCLTWIFLDGWQHMILIVVKIIVRSIRFVCVKGKYILFRQQTQRKICLPKVLCHKPKHLSNSNFGRLTSPKWLSATSISCCLSNTSFESANKRESVVVFFDGFFCLSER